MGYLLLTWLSLGSLLFPTQIAAEESLNATSLDYGYTIIEHQASRTWHIQHGSQIAEILENPDNSQQLAAYQALIDNRNTQLTTLIIYGLFVITVCITLIVILFTKPKKLKHPIPLLLCGIASILFFKLYTQIDLFQANSDNIRYYHLLLTLS